MSLMGNEISASEEAFLQKLRISLATAIIRNKPDGCTGKQYAEQVAAKLQKKNEDWKEKTKTLEQELLQTKQELALLKLNLPCKNHPDNTEDDGDDDETQLVNLEANMNVLTPPSSASSSEERFVSEQTLPQILKRNSQFLYSISALKHQALSTQKDLMDTTVESIKLAIENIQSCLLSDLEHDGMQQMMRDAVECLLAAVGSLHGAQKERIVELLKQFVEDLIVNMAQNGSSYATQDFISEIIVKLGQSDDLILVILRKLLTNIKSTASHIRDVTTQGFELDQLLYTSSFYWLRTFENLLTILEERFLKRKDVFWEDERVEPMDGLENSLLPITDQFPLFAHYVWRLMGMLEWMGSSKGLQ